MIVRCENCKTRFRLDPARIKGASAKVRCSRCGNVFEVAKPAEAKIPAAADSAVSTSADAAPVSPGSVSSSSVKGISSVKIKRWILMGLGAAMVVVVLVAGWRFWSRSRPAPAAPSSKTAKGDPGNRKLTLLDVDGSFLETEKMGKVFVINGLVRNDYSYAVRFIRLEAFLQNDEKATRRVVVYAGNPLTSGEIRALDSKNLTRILNTKEGKNQLNDPVPPGDSVPFTVVFTDLPPNPTQYTVKALDSQPA